MAEPTGVATQDERGDDEQFEDIPAEYTSETPYTATEVPQPSAVGAAAGTGRRKAAIARVRIRPGDGSWKLNGMSLDAYFPNKVHQQTVSDPFTTLDVAGSFDVIATIDGGGTTGQAGALRLGVARALIAMDPDNRPALKKAGFLTRDAREKERKKYGLKKARKAPQYSKR